MEAWDGGERQGGLVVRFLLGPRGPFRWRNARWLSAHLSGKIRFRQVLYFSAK